MSYTTSDIQTWLGQCTERMIAAAPELNELDGRLGDGHLGATLEKCAGREHAIDGRAFLHFGNGNLASVRGDHYAAERRGICRASLFSSRRCIRARL